MLCEPDQENRVSHVVVEFNFRLPYLQEVAKDKLRQQLKIEQLFSLHSGLNQYEGHSNLVGVRPPEWILFV